jgi:2-keto-4-pentenoate hydratase/2-oxohepta-3-ene-1,7-dioic acid hydratase in catechol pathway
MYFEITMPIEKTVTKRPLESLRERENPWLRSTPQERLAAMAVICQTQDDGKPESRLSRLHYTVGKKVR